MPCAAGELCNLADVELIAPNGRECGHECRGGCGGHIETFGIAAKKNLLAAASTSAADKKLETFTASEKWVRNFISRNGMSSVVLHGEAGSVNDEAIAEGLAEIRKACQEY